MVVGRAKVPVARKCLERRTLQTTPDCQSRDTRPESGKLCQILQTMARLLHEKAHQQTGFDCKSIYLSQEALLVFIARVNVYSMQSDNTGHCLKIHLAQHLPDPEL